MGYIKIDFKLGQICSVPSPMVMYRQENSVTPWFCLGVGGATESMLVFGKL